MPSDVRFGEAVRRGSAALSVLAASLAWACGPTASAPAELEEVSAGAVIDSGSAVLPDGTRMTIDGRVRVREASATAVVLEFEKGYLVLDVPPMAGRRFVVLTTKAKIHVVSSAFSVSDPQLVISVERGSVDVHLWQRVETLEAHSTWIHGPVYPDDLSDVVPPPRLPEDM